MKLEKYNSTLPFVQKPSSTFEEPKSKAEIEYSKELAREYANTYRVTEDLGDDNTCHPSFFFSKPKQQQANHNANSKDSLLKKRTYGESTIEDTNQLNTHKQNQKLAQQIFYPQQRGQQSKSKIDEYPSYNVSPYSQINHNQKMEFDKSKEIESHIQKPGGNILTKNVLLNTPLTYLHEKPKQMPNINIPMKRNESPFVEQYCKYLPKKQHEDYNRCVGQVNSKYQR